MSKNIKFAIIFVVTFILVFTALMFGLKTPANKGKKAPDFTIITFSEKKITLSKLDKNKVAVINFWASWCGPCREEAPALEQTWRKYKDKINFIGLNWRDEKKDALAFLKEFNITYPNGAVNDKVASAYGLTGVPETFVIKEGQIKKHLIGPTTVDELSQLIEELL